MWHFTPAPKFSVYIRTRMSLRKIAWSQFLRPAIYSNTANSAWILDAVPRQSFVIHPNGGWWQSTPWWDFLPHSMSRVILFLSRPYISQKSISRNEDDIVLVSAYWPASETKCDVTYLSGCQYVALIVHLADGGF
jgi:hypothetical protein